MGLIEKVAREVWDEISKPESFRKGEEFEAFIRNKLFTKDDYDMLERTHDYSSNKQDYVDSSKKPDYKLKSKKSGKEFYVEAKYRSALSNGSFEFKPYQLKRYKIISKETPVYILIGVGQEAKSPEQVFLIPLKDVKYTTLFRSFLTRYQIPLNRSKRAIDAIVEP